MNEAIEEFRYEVKFVCPEPFRNKFDLWLQYARERFFRSYDNRIVNNIYFDSLDMRDFYENVAGISYRAKTRLRWYGDTMAPAAMTLEHKIKRGRISRKQALRLEGIDLGAIAWDELSDHLCARAEYSSCAIASYFKNPVLRNRYRRRYYETRGHRLRMTVDSDLAFYDAAGTAGPAGSTVVRTHSSVVEFKAPVARAGELQRLLEDIPLRMTRFSKYVMGVDQTRVRGDTTFAEPL